MNTIKQLFISSAIFVSSLGVAAAQELTYDIELTTYFDNREYSTIFGTGGRPWTEFAERLTPQLGYKFDDDNIISFGVNTYVPFAESGGSLFESVELVLYYGYDSENWSATAGIFPRNRMMTESYSTAFFSKDYLFTDNLMSGIMGRYFVGESFVEAVCDWESQPSEESRERFRLLSAGRRYWSKFYAGYNFSLTHFAGQQAENLTNVVDNILLNPRVGMRLSGKYDFDISLAYLQSLQQDRSYADGWEMPAMGELSFLVSRWGLTLSNEFYFGDDLFPLYDGHVAEDGTVVEYGSLLYTGDRLFCTSGGYYNRTSLGYNRKFFDDKLSVGAQFVTHLDSSGLGTEQIVNIGVKLGGAIYNADNSRK